MTEQLCCESDMPGHTLILLACPAELVILSLLSARFYSPSPSPVTEKNPYALMQVCVLKSLRALGCPKPGVIYPWLRTIGGVTDCPKDRGKLPFA